ncbi:MAG TPA: hypothetical protein VJA46_06140 [Acidimicrobiia bacterium]|nr:hypothetical protein [Acidimicrobiia bacterium]
MDDAEITETLHIAEVAVKAGEPLGPTGFWRAVAAVKADPALIEEHADRIGVIDSTAFRNWALMTVPLWIGNLVMIGGTLLGLALVGWSYSLGGTGAAIAFLLGFGAILVATHSLGHLLVGSWFGIRFTRWFIGTFRRPQPGVKLDYASYLRAPARSRAWMHASGAVVTKIVPFALIGAALAAAVPSWVIWVLLVVGIGQIVTDALWSTNASDWKKYLREMRFAQSS